MGTLQPAPRVGILAGRRYGAGKRRYYARLAAHARAFLVPGSRWFDHWHEHVDMRGFSNLGGRHRALHLEALFLMFDGASPDERAGAVQIFLRVDARDGSNDAIYAHTPNPNGTPFPFAFAVVAWPASPPRLLAPMLLRRPELELGRCEAEEGTTYYVRRRERQ